MTNVISCCNQKGGTGKTTTCANLGIGLAMERKKVLLVDCDPQGSLSISLNNSKPLVAQGFVPHRWYNMCREKSQNGSKSLHKVVMWMYKYSSGQIGLADKIYRNRENPRFCKEHGIRLSGPALGRPKKGEVRSKTQDFLDECERVKVKRRFSLAKRKCGLGLIMTKLRQTIAHSVAMSILVLNLSKIPCALMQLLALLALWMVLQKKQPLFS